MHTGYQVTDDNRGRIRQQKGDAFQDSGQAIYWEQADDQDK